MAVAAQSLSSRVLEGFFHLPAVSENALREMVLKFVQGGRRKGRRDASDAAEGGDASPSFVVRDRTLAVPEERVVASGVRGVAPPTERLKPAPRSFKKPERKPYRSDDRMKGVHFVESDEDLERLIEKSRRTGSKLFVEFGTAWCDHCKSMIPFMSDLGRKHRRHTFAVADVFHTPSTSKTVVYTPTFWIYDRGVKVDQMVGSDKQSLTDKAWLHLL